MKQLFSVISALVPFLSTAQTTGLTINGVLSNVKDPVPTVYFSYNAKIDSVAVKNDQYTYFANIDGPTSIIFWTINPWKLALQAAQSKSDTSKNVVINGLLTPKDVKELFLVPGTVNVSSKDSFSNIRISGPGSTAHAEYEKVIKNKFSPLFDHPEKLRAACLNYLKANPGSPIALEVLNVYKNYGFGKEQPDMKAVASLYNQLSPAVRNSPHGRRYEQSITDYFSRNKALDALMNAPAPDFTMNDTLDNPVALSSFRGKYVLIDFWASWCAPCRKENPNLVKAFNTYKNKGFTILGISMDTKKEPWLKAIQKDGLPWTHVSELNGMESKVGKLYHVEGIPDNFLIDPSGKIIGRYLRGDQLEKKLQEIFR